MAEKWFSFEVCGGHDLGERVAEILKREGFVRCSKPTNPSVVFHLWTKGSILYIGAGNGGSFLSQKKRELEAINPAMKEVTCSEIREFEKYKG